MARYLITGGAGFVGAELAASLAARGDEVLAFDLRSSSKLDDLMRREQGISFVAGEIVEWPGIASALQQFRPDALIHCAAIVGVRASLDMPMQTMRVNVEGSLNVLEAMRLFGVRRMIHISSEETYGDFQSDLISEDHPQNPLMAYGVSKLAVEHLGRSYARRYGLECLNLRTSWVYGPGLPRARVPNTLIDAAIAGRPLKMANGADFRVDHTYIADLVDGILLALDRAEHPFDAYHIASGAAPSLAEIAAVIRDIVPDADLSLGPGTIDFVPGLPAWKKGALDITRAMTTLGYHPRFDIRAGIAATVEALRAQRAS